MGRMLHKIGEALLGLERIEEGQGDPTRIYYVYAIYFIFNGREIWLYVGKGSGDRIDQHEKILKRKLRLKYKLDAHERLMLLVQDMGYEVHKRIIASGLSEDEAYNLENKMITDNGMMQRGNVAYPHRLVYTRKRK